MLTSTPMNLLTGPAASQLIVWHFPAQPETQYVHKCVTTDIHFKIWFTYQLDHSMGLKGQTVAQLVN